MLNKRQARRRSAELRGRDPTLAPLALAIGQGSAIQRPLAIAIISGLLLQFPLVLLIMPGLIGLTLTSPESEQNME